MGREIEWRFAVARINAIPTEGGVSIVQAYLAEGSPGVRVRIKGDEAYLTIKADKGAPEPGRPVERHEFEYPIPVQDARELMVLCDNRIEKKRYDLAGGIELDVFSGEHEGLVIAEIEIEGTGENELLEPAPPPGWQWINVSSDVRYSNFCLAKYGVPPGAPSAAFLT